MITLYGDHVIKLDSGPRSYFIVCLRIQVNPQNKNEFQNISPERAFADFIFAHVILHLVVINFIG